MIENIPYVDCEGVGADGDRLFFTGLGLPCLENTPQDGPWISRESGRLGLHIRMDGRVVSSVVDFSDPALLHRLKTSGKRQGLGQAIGLNRHPEASVVDGTAGLGRDSFILAGLGCSVIMLERNPLVHYLLQDGLRRGVESSNPVVSGLCSRLNLRHTDTLSWCRETGQDNVPDVIYLDPMFPARVKSAKVKKAIAGLQLLAGTDEDVAEVLKSCLATAGKRVVVKRPRSSDRRYFEGIAEPMMQLTGKTVQYDVFLATQ